jgi:acetyl-CoA carboxylase biotin carboxyl carrier protein
MAEKDSDLERIQELIKIMRDNDLVELEIKHGDEQICLKRAQPQVAAVAAVPAIGAGVQQAAAAVSQRAGLSPGGQFAAQQSGQELVEIKSPIVGTFYQTPSPDSEPYAQVGSHVEPQTVVCIIEAMKVMNEIKAETSGTIAEVCAANGQAVEYGQVLFRVTTD